MAPAISDEILIQQVLKGHEQAFSTLVKRYEQFAFTLALRIVKQREDALEVAQDSFVRAYRYLPDFRGDARFSTWLYKIVYSTALNFIRKKQPDIRSLDDDQHPVIPPQSYDGIATDNLEIIDRNTALQKAVELLSPDDASVITLFYLYEKSLDEICQITGLTLSNAKTKLCRARQRLKSIIQDKFATEIL